MILTTWGQVLNSSFQQLWMGVIKFIPNLIVAVVIFCIGWAIGAIISKGVKHFMRMIKFDEALRKAGFEDFVRRSGLNLDSGKFIGEIIKYFIIVVFLVASFDVLGLSQVTLFLGQVVLGYLPQLIIAILILLVGAVVGDVLGRIVKASARAANLSQANFLGAVSKWGVWIFAVLVALTQMGIASTFIQTIFTGLVVALSLALGLSFGLGGQQAASRSIEKMSESIKAHNK